MRAFGVFCLLGACATYVPPTLATPARLPTPPPIEANVVTSEPPPIEPSLPNGRCAIGGQAVSLATESIELCGAPGTACFGRLPAHTWGVTVDALRVAPSLAAQMIFSGNGVTVSAIVDAQNVELHPRSVELVDRWFIPEWARLSLVRVHDDAAELSVKIGADVTPVAPLVVDRACDRITIDPPLFEMTEIETAAGLGHKAEVFVTPATGTLDVRASVGGARVATLQCARQLVWVYARSKARVRAIIPVDGGWIVGWIDGASLAHPGGGSHRTRPPTVRMSVAATGVSCDHDVDVLAKVGEATVHAATIRAGTVFDPMDAAEALHRAGVEPLPGVSARIAPSAVADCEALP